MFNGYSTTVSIPYNLKTTDAMVAWLNELPLNVDSLNLYGFRLGIKEEIRLSPAFLALPRNLKHLNLNSNNLGARTGRKLANCFKLLPPTLDALDLSSNFNESNIPDLGMFFPSLPKSLSILDLSTNRLCLKPTKELIDAFLSLSSSLVSLNLNLNALGCKKNGKLALIANSLPKQLKYLYLEHNKLNLRSGAELSLFIDNLPKSLIFLDLGNNGLSDESFEHSTFSFIPRGLTHLKLNYNKFGHINTGTLCSLFASLPQELESLDLSDNDLGNKTTEELFAIFSSLPKGLKSLNLFHNNLGGRTVEELIYLFSALPKGLNTLDFANDYFDLTDDELTSIIYKLPPNLTTVRFKSGTPLNIEEFWNKKLSALCVNVEDIMFTPMKPTYEINEVVLKLLLIRLERYNTPESLLVCGLLLEGRIENTIQPKDNLKNCLKKRTHKAITYYINAAIRAMQPNEKRVDEIRFITEREQPNSVLQLIEYLLCEIIMGCKSSSVQDRLNQYDLDLNRSSIANLTSYLDEFSQVRSPVTNKVRLFSEPPQKPCEEDLMDIDFNCAP